jgi:hypothetical protein
MLHRKVCDQPSGKDNRFVPCKRILRCLVPAQLSRVMRAVQRRKGRVCNSDTQRCANLLFLLVFLRFCDLRAVGQNRDVGF